MSEVDEAIDAAISEAESLRKSLKRNGSVQVRSAEEQSLIKATALTWFNNHRPVLASLFDDDVLSPLDGMYRQILSSCQRAAVRSAYVRNLKVIKDQLVELRSENAVRLASAGRPAQQTSDQPPTFTPLIADPPMQDILTRRWHECTVCIDAGAPLAAVVMMGGLLEALLLARINRESNKGPIFKTTAAPKDKSGKTKPLNEWMLRSYIDVAHELGWISHSAKDVGDVLRDYRNYIHPYKELSHGVNINGKDALILWEVSKSISRQVIESVV